MRYAKSFLVALLLTTSAAQASDGGLSDGGGMPAPNAGPCDGLAGATFVSVNEYETGLGPDGPVLGHWQIHFDASSYRYDLSDFSLSGTYTCSGPEGFVTNGETGSFGFTGYYQKDAGLLLWHERWFRRE